MKMRGIVLGFVLLAGTIHCGDDAVDGSGASGGSGGSPGTGGNGANNMGGGPVGGGGEPTGGGGSGPGPSALDCTPIVCDEGSGRTVDVAAGSDLQAALDAAMPGDTLVLPAGSTFTGHFVLREKAGDACITIRTSTRRP